MFKKYRFPLNLFIVLEKINPVIYTSECFTQNHYAALIPTEWYFPFHKVLKNDITSASSTLIEQSCIDSKYFDYFNDSFFEKFKDQRLIFFNIYYNYHIKVRLSVLTSLPVLGSIISIDSLYKNAVWLERETSEMFSVAFTNKSDVRNLLLDYSRTEYPMLKEFPCEGYFDIYYDIFEDQLQYFESEFVEL